MAEITQREAEQIDTANASGLTPVVFVHGLWLLANSWNQWRDVFAAGGYATLAPGWPDDPTTVKEGNEHPEKFARKTVGQIADHLEAVIKKLTAPPALVGHSFGGLLVQC
jgi:non-heme chloroperoxidase